MPFAAIEAYLKTMELRKTEMKLMMADVAMLPHIKQGSRSAALERWVRLLNIHDAARAKTASPGRLKMMGIGVRFVNQ